MRMDTSTRSKKAWTLLLVVVAVLNVLVSTNRGVVEAWVIVPARPITRTRRTRRTALRQTQKEDAHCAVTRALASAGLVAICSIWNPCCSFAEAMMPTSRSSVVTAAPSPVVVNAPFYYENYLSSLLLSSSSEQHAETVLEEVWTYVDKYYFDQTFQGQDWKQVKEKYKALIDKEKNNEGRTMKLITEMVATLGDKYSRILDKDQYAAIQKYDLIGVGVTLMPDEHKDIIVGSPPVAGTASDKVGLQVGDFVRAINGVPTKDKTAFDIIDQIAENPNAKTITMTIQKKNDNNNIQDVVMDRQFLEVKDPIRYKISETRPDGTKVGFVRIAEFNAIVETKLEQALRTLENEGANAYVIDLRLNTGGAFQSAVEISGFFLDPNQVATYVVDNSNQKLPFTTPKGRTPIIDATDPVVLWVDGLTASASEVLAGSLHDNCRAVVMGDKTFGKGLIQAVYGLKNGAGLVLTVAQYVTPNGTEIQNIGVIPDLKANLPLPLPGIGSDTSKVDFTEIKRRLDPKFCTPPSQQQTVALLDNP